MGRSQESVHSLIDEWIEDEGDDIEEEMVYFTKQITSFLNWLDSKESD